MKICFKEHYNNAEELDKIIKKVRNLGGKVFATSDEYNIEIQCESSKKKQIKEAINKIKNQEETY